ncbi:MAG: response regulator transcription factor [Bacteroidota bacterium]
MQVAVIIYEDNNDLRETLSNMVTFSQNLLLLGNFARAGDAAKQVQDLRPDIILMDIDMPGISGIDAVKSIRSVNQLVPIIMLTVFDDNKHVLESIKAGASGYLLKKHLSQRLIISIEEALAGEVPMSPGIARMIIAGMQQKTDTPAPKELLTTREKQILAHLSKGNTYKVIAMDFTISIDTVRSHIKSIYEKLKVHNQAEAVSKAFQQKLL